LFNLKSNENILIIRSAFIGDYVITLPFIDYLLNVENIPRKNIHTLIINNKNFNPLKLLFKANDDLLKNSYVFDTSDYLKSIFRLRLMNKFKEIIYLPFYSETRLSIFKKKIIFKLSFGLKNNIHGMNLYSNEFSNQYYYYFKALGLYNSKLQLRFNYRNILKIDQQETNQIKNKFKKANYRVAFYINSKLDEKKWDIENFFYVHQYLKEKLNTEIFLIGSKEDRLYNQNFIKKYNLYQVNDLSGNLSLRELIVFFENTDLLISNDGAPVHLAALTNCKIFAIYSYLNELKSGNRLRTWDPIISNSFITVRNSLGIKKLEFDMLKKYLDKLIKSNYIKESILI
tara:strand:- start:398 stop:1426 length:1029 start_codon:yes stop_codon:yes gene_type:complete